ncbi:nicotinamide riboside transporter PnuC [Carnobacterium gallinarum]|uniref:nicotinamide riboside transporter PnuC n=1 Tax=Carnobacterium gallinarum TaxID=2749 RepID=UPI00055768B7|nr:nicotinamide riboside transporter PnuC [Carnobacterium gallinarum]
MVEKIRRELFSGWTNFEKIYICLLLLLQVVVFYFNPESLMGVIAGISGVLCVTFVAKGKISNYFFGFIQISLYLLLSIEYVLYGEVLLNLFYFIMQIIGVSVWRKNMTTKVEKDNSVVEVKGLSLKQWVITIVTVIVSWYLFGSMLAYFGSNSPYLDSITTSLSVVAQILMTWRYKEQWLLWIVVNVFSIALWIVAGNASMVAMWTAFLFNSSYGYYNWLRLAKIESR